MNDDAWPSSIPVFDIGAAPRHVPEPAPERAWGPWATVGWTVLAMLVGSVVCLALGLAAGIVIGIISVATSRMDLDAEQAVKAHEGLIQLLAYLPMMGVTLAFLVIPVRMRKFGYGCYMGLTRTRAGWYVLGLAAIVGFLSLEEGAMVLADRSAPQWMSQVWATCDSVLLLWAVVVIAAPLSEEMLFRGFLFRGLAQSRLGIWPAIVISSLLWTGVHVQYGLPELTSIFLSGLMLGWIRHVSGSIGPAIVMHVAMNLFAMVLFAVAYS
ncbi:MAG: CPBP family intramembrane metalloprotease [Phycisphaeraceae bacterium]|nr:CPBP family intramembrane metalloprotease [Phycisphaeraceae bacterium]